MRRIRSRAIAVAALLTAVGIALLVTAPAQASVSEGCHASLNDVSIDTLPLDTAHAIVVGQDDVVPMTMSGPSDKDFNNLDISLTFFGTSWSVYNESASGGTWSHNVDVHSFARLGVGLYLLGGVGHFVGGGSCIGRTLVRVTGDPFSTVAGIAGAAATGVGVLSVLGAGVAAGGGGGGGSGPGGSVTQEDVAKDEERERTDNEVGSAIDSATGHGWCFLALAALPLLLLLFGTSALMTSVAAPAAARPRRRKWPFVVGPIGGLLTGLGACVLLQEYAVVYPTRTWGIIYIAGGIAFGLAVPLLRRKLSR